MAGTHRATRQWDALSFTTPAWAYACVDGGSDLDGWYEKMVDARPGPVVAVQGSESDLESMESPTSADSLTESSGGSEYEDTMSTSSAASTQSSATSCGTGSGDSLFDGSVVSFARSSTSLVSSSSSSSASKRSGGTSRPWYTTFPAQVSQLFCIGTHLPPDSWMALSKVKQHTLCRSVRVVERVDAAGATPAHCSHNPHYDPETHQFCRTMGDGCGGRVKVIAAPDSVPEDVRNCTDDCLLWTQLGRVVRVNGHRIDVQKLVYCMRAEAPSDIGAMRIEQLCLRAEGRVCLNVMHLQMQHARPWTHYADRRKHLVPAPWRTSYSVLGARAAALRAAPGAADAR